MTCSITHLAVPFLLSVLLFAYIVWNDRRLTKTPLRALRLTPERVSPSSARDLAFRLETSVALFEKEVLPPKTGRRYIIVGGGGFLGAWIAAKLLQRGEDPQNIRLLDLHGPTNFAVVDAMPRGLQFVKVDITDADATEASFKLPWPSSASDSGITVFHSAASIRFFERHLEFFGRSAKVNVDGTRNVVNATKSAGADVLVYTSSSAVGLHRTRLFLWPWEKEPEQFVQVIDDDDSRYPTRHDDFFSNYAASKRQGELLVRASDNLPLNPTQEKVLRTGCIRPGMGIFGPRGDMNCGAFLVRRHNPSWAASVIQSYNYVENCAAAHLCYEARLLELQSGSSNHPDIGGDAFVVADPGPPPTCGDLYTLMETLTDGDCTFPHISPTLLMLLAVGIEWYYRYQQGLVRTKSPFAKFFPELKGDIAVIQPSLFPLVCTHTIVDDSRARLPPEKGGLGYTGLWTSLEGIHRTVEEFKSGVGLSDRRSEAAGVGLSMRFWKAKKTTSSSNMADPLPIVALAELSITQ